MSSKTGAGFGNIKPRNTVAATSHKDLQAQQGEKKEVKRVVLTLTPEEKYQLERAAAGRGLKLAPFLRAFLYENGILSR